MSERGTCCVPCRYCTTTSGCPPLSGMKTALSEGRVGASAPETLPEGLQPLRLRQVAVEFAHLQPHQPQKDVHAVGLLLGLGEQHHMVGEGSHQQSCQGDKSEPAATSTHVLLLARGVAAVPGPHCVELQLPDRSREARAASGPASLRR